jgi:hypothetical protein
MTELHVPTDADPCPFTLGETILLNFENRILIAILTNMVP